MKAVWVALALLLSAGAPLLSAGAALAQAPDDCTFEVHPQVPLFVGITRQEIAITCPSTGRSTAHVVRVDLHASGLSFETSTFAPGKDKFYFDLTTTFLSRTKSQVAVNANLFSHCCTDAPPIRSTDLCGLEISHGRFLSKWDHVGKECTSGHPYDTSLTVTGATSTIAPSATVSPGVEAAITGSDKLVSDHNNVAPTGSGDWFGPNARSVVGLSENNKVLWIAAIDGANDSVGVTLRQAAALMINLGAATALNLDGGGSTSLAVEAPDGAATLLNFPSDPLKFGIAPEACTVPKGKGCERYVGAVFGVHAQPLPPTSR